MKTKLLFIAFVASSASMPAASDECVDMAWKVPGEYLAFDTIMEEAGDKSKFSMNFESALGEESVRREAAKMFEGFEFPKTSSMTAVLRRGERGMLKVKVVMGAAKFDAPPESEQAAQMRKMMEAMAGTVQLRGEMNSSGEITSFYLPQRQKNLLNIFFELPAKCVEVGDEWSLDINLLEMDQNFIADKTSRYNTVRLAAIEKRAGATIAVLDYFVLEAVSGTLNVPMQDRSVPTGMNMGFSGRGYFNVTEGRWQQLVGTLSMDSSGVMNAGTTQLLALRPVAHVAAEILNAK